MGGADSKNERPEEEDREAAFAKRCELREKELLEERKAFKREYLSDIIPSSLNIPFTMGGADSRNERPEEEEEREAAKRRELEEKELQEHHALMRVHLLICDLLHRRHLCDIILRAEEEREAASAKRREIMKLLEEHHSFMREYVWIHEHGPHIPRRRHHFLHRERLRHIHRAEEEKREKPPAKRPEIRKLLEEHNALMRKYLRPYEPGPFSISREDLCDIILRAVEEREEPPAKRPEIRELLEEHNAFMREYVWNFENGYMFFTREDLHDIILRAEEEREDPPATRREIRKLLGEHNSLMREYLWPYEPGPFFFPREVSHLPGPSSPQTAFIQLPPHPSVPAPRAEEEREAASATRREIMKLLGEHHSFMRENLLIRHLLPRVYLWNFEPGSNITRPEEEEREDPPEESSATRPEIRKLKFIEEHNALMRTERERADSPEPSCVSLRSGRSMDYPTAFNQQDFIPKTEEKRADSPPPSCVSMRSDRSMDYPTAFQQQHLIPKTEEKRADSPSSSCVSMKSDHSMDYPVAFKRQDAIPTQRAGSSAPSCLSLKSDCSRNSPPLFSDKPGPSDTKQRAGSPAPSCVSMKSDRSKGNPPLFRDEPGPSDTKDPVIDAGLWTEVNSIFSLLRENIVDFVDIELNTFMRFLTNDPEGLESQVEYEEGLNAKEKAQRRGSREGLLKITLDFLRRMNQEELADSLQDKALAAVGHGKPKSKLKHAIGCVFGGFARAMRSGPMFK